MADTPIETIQGLPDPGGLTPMGTDAQPVRLSSPYRRLVEVSWSGAGIGVITYAVPVIAQESDAPRGGIVIDFDQWETIWTMPATTLPDGVDFAFFDPGPGQLKASFWDDARAYVNGIFSESLTATPVVSIGPTQDPGPLHDLTITQFYAYPAAPDVGTVLLPTYDYTDVGSSDAWLGGCKSGCTSDQAPITACGIMCHAWWGAHHDPEVESATDFDNQSKSDWPPDSSLQNILPSTPSETFVLQYLGNTTLTLKKKQMVLNLKTLPQPWTFSTFTVGSEFSANDENIVPRPASNYGNPESVVNVSVYSGDISGFALENGLLVPGAGNRLIAEIDIPYHPVLGVRTSPDGQPLFTIVKSPLAITPGKPAV